MDDILDYSKLEPLNKLCRKCGITYLRGTPDPCLGYLDGVAHACCGHGDIELAYACGWPGCVPNQSWNDGQNPLSWRLDGEEAKEFFERMKNAKENS